MLRAGLAGTPETSSCLFDTSLKRYIRMNKSKRYLLEELFRPLVSLGMQDQQKDQSTGSTGSTTGGTEEETAPRGKQGQHWRGEPWAKNPKVGGKETPGTEAEPGTSGQHWRGEDMPLERGRETGTERKQQTGAGGESSAVTSDRPDEC